MEPILGNGPGVATSPNAAFIRAAVDYGLNEERVALRPPTRQTLVSDKWERIVDAAERYLRREGVIRP